LKKPFSLKIIASSISETAKKSIQFSVKNWANSIIPSP